MSFMTLMQYAVRRDDFAKQTLFEIQQQAQEKFLQAHQKFTETEQSIRVRARQR